MDVFNGRFNCRVFDAELKRIDKVIREAQDDAGESRYQNRSHFMRCAVMRLLRIEERNMGD